MKYFLLFFIIIPFYSTSSFSQNEFANHWHFGKNVHMDFSNGNAVIDNNSALETFESSISYSNTNGDLLFYSDMGSLSGFGGSIWNKNHQVMPNGYLADSSGCQSTLNGGIVIPDFNNSDIYHIYMTDCSENVINQPSKHIGLRRTTVDMSLDGGLGDVIIKGMPIYGDSLTKMSEGIAATRHANGTDYWVVTHSYSLQSPHTDTFYTFLVSAAGISAPIVQKIGVLQANTEIEISPDGNKLVFGKEVYDFNKSSGNLSTPIDLGYEVWGKSFSPNSSYLYTTDGFNLFQYDMNASNLVGSQTIIYSASDTVNHSFANLQMGPNCKIYVSLLDLPFFGLINLANYPGISCNYVHQALTHNSTNGLILVFPNYIESEFDCQTASVADVFFTSWTLYQSLTEKKITLNCSDKHIGEKYHIIDTQGKNILQGILSTTTTHIDISSFEKGMYFVQTLSTTHSEKFVVH